MVKKKNLLILLAVVVTIWRIPENAQLIPDSERNSGHITYTAYGDGPLPLLLGSVIVLCA